MSSTTSWERVIGFTATTPLEAVLEARESFADEKTQFLEMLAELSMEKVSLEGKVAAMAQQAEITKEMLALVSENARLKAQAEMAEAKLTIVHEMAKLAMENEQLKLQLQVASDKRNRESPATFNESKRPAQPDAAGPLNATFFTLPATSVKRKSRPFRR
jgi:cell shape-determining protein MreC